MAIYIGYIYLDIRLVDIGVYLGAERSIDEN